MKNYFARHLQVLFSTLGDLLRTPIRSFNTILAVSVALTLPSLFYIAYNSAYSLTDTWQGRPQISIFLAAEIEADEANLIFEEIRLLPEIELAEYLSPEQALDEFRQLSGFGVELEILEENPLPPSIVMMPAVGFQQSRELLELKQKLLKIDGIDTIRLDLEWVDRFNQLIDIAHRFSHTIAALLAFTFMLVIATTVQLLILARAKEIEITKLVGGTNSFVRRPFLYYGAFIGLFSGLTCCFLIALAYLSLSQWASNVSGYYRLSETIYRLNILEYLLIVGLATILGWLAARISMIFHLHKVRPR